MDKWMGGEWGFKRVTAREELAENLELVKGSAGPADVGGKKGGNFFSGGCGAITGSVEFAGTPRHQGLCPVAVTHVFMVADTFRGLDRELCAYRWELKPWT